MKIKLFYIGIFWVYKLIVFVKVMFLNSIEFDSFLFYDSDFSYLVEWEEYRIYFLCFFEFIVVEY